MALRICIRPDYGAGYECCFGSYLPEYFLTYGNTGPKNYGGCRPQNHNRVSIFRELSHLTVDPWDRFESDSHGKHDFTAYSRRTDASDCRELDEDCQLTIALYTTAPYGSVTRNSIGNCLIVLKDICGIQL